MSLPETHIQEPLPPRANARVHIRVSQGPGNTRGPTGWRVVLEVGGVGPLPAVCNAGRGLLGPLEVHSVDTVGSVLDVNVVGTVRVLQAFLPDMKRRRSGRILVTASMGGLMGKWKGTAPGETGTGLLRCKAFRGSARLRASAASPPLEGLPFSAVYCASKFAIEGLCESLAILLLPFGVQ